MAVLTDTNILLRLLQPHHPHCKRTKRRAGYEEIESIKRFWILLPDVPLFEEWQRLVKIYRVSGKSTHDARPVAAMRVHEIRKILTFNVDDFTRYTDITVLDPKKVIGEDKELVPPG